MRILITGGTGLIGRALCKALLAAGHQLTVLSRSPTSVAAKCGTQVNAMSSLDEWQPETVFDAVINLAGEPIIDKAWSEQRKKAIWVSRVTLTETLVQRIRQAHKKPKVLLSGSAIGYYGDCGAKSLDESAANTNDFGAQLCAAWERAAQAAIDDGVRVCLLRTGLVLSSDGGLFTRMRLPFKLGLGGRLGNGQQYMSWIHIADYVAIVQWLLNDSNASGAFNLTAPNPVSNRQFTETLAKTLQRPAWLHTPAWLLSAILGQRAYLLTGGQRVLPRRIQELGYQFRHEQLQPALQQLVNENAP